MATGSSEVASPNTRLDEKDLPELLRVLHPARIEYNSFGLQIGVGVGEIVCIERMYQDPRHCLREILTARLKKSEPLTWNGIVAALREECVGLGKIADDIRQQYAHLFTPTISMASEYEHGKRFDMVIREADSEDDEKETCRQCHERVSEQDSDEEVGGREKRTQSLRKRESKHEIKSKDILKPKEYASIKKKSAGGDHRARVSKEGERSSEYEGIKTVRYMKHVQEVESEDEEDVALSRKENKRLSKRKGGKPAHDREKQVHKKDKFMKDESQSEPEEVREISKQKKKATHDQEEKKIESEDEDIGYTVPEEAITESESEISSERETLDPEICQFTQRKELLHAKAAKSEHYELLVQNPKRLKVEETQSSSQYSGKRGFVNVKGSVGTKGKSRKSAGVKKSKARRPYEAQRGKTNAGNNPKYSEMKPVQSVVTKPVQSVVTEAPFLGKKSKQHSLPKQEMKGEYTSKDSSSSEEEMQSSSLVLSRPSTSRSVLGGIEESTERLDSESYSSREQEEPDPRGKRRRRKIIRETSDTPLASDPSSYPTSENETRRKYDGPEWQRRKCKHARYHRRGRERHRERERQESSSSSSDSADSSPECDRNLSESESRKLKRLFKCAFGRLCRAITNPDEVAAEMQAKRLLSRSATERILTSPESKQEKAIFLVRALARRIKPRPDRVFTAIEVFLSSEGLQDIGAEMKIKAGKLAFQTCV